MIARRQMRRGRPSGVVPYGQYLTALLRIAVAITAITVIAATPWSTSRARAQDTGGSSELETKLDLRGTLMLRDASLADWAFAIKQEWGINIVSAADLKDEMVDGAFEDTALREILSEILFVRGFGFQAVGNSLRILKLEDMGIMRPGFVTEIIPLEILSPNDVESSINLLTSPGATVQSIPSSGSLIVIDTPAQIEKIKAHLEFLENNAKKRNGQLGTGGPSGSGFGIDIRVQGNQVEVFQIQFLNAEDIIGTVESVVPDGRVGSLEDENRLVVVASPNEVAAVAALLKKIDVARRQVRITALLYDVDVEVVEQFGFNWSHAVKGRLNAADDPNSLFAFGNQNFPATATLNPLPGNPILADTAATAFDSTSLGGITTLTNLSRHFDMRTVIRALDTTDGSRLLARPNIIAYDRTEAIFQSVSEIPVQELTQTTAGGNIGTTTFREAGIKLTVTPRIMEDDTIVMVVTPEFSVLAGFQGGNPIIDRRTATTTVQLRNRQTTVIGGLLRRNEFETQTGLPGLSKLKYFGVLFRDHDTTVKETELLVFITAEIIPLEQPMPERDEAARTVAVDLLEQVPYASHDPVMPYCGDPYCPYHHPRPWGSALPPSACTACAQDGSFGHFLYDPKYYGPAPSIQGESWSPQGETLPPHGETLPPQGETLPPAGEPEIPPTELNAPVSPVTVDETQRRLHTRQQTSVRRLPLVNPYPPMGLNELRRQSPTRQQSAIRRLPAMKSGPSVGVDEARRQSSARQQTAIQRLPAMNPGPSVGVDEARRQSSARQQSAIQYLPPVKPGPSPLAAMRTDPVSAGQQVLPVARPQSGYRPANPWVRPLPPVDRQVRYDNGQLRR